jgi:hypothetical protein
LFSRNRYELDSAEALQWREVDENRQRQTAESKRQTQETCAGSDRKEFRAHRRPEIAPVPLQPASAALVRRAGEAGVAGDSLAIAQVAREDLVDQHLRRLDANAEEARNETYHRVRAFLPGRGRREFAQASLLDRADLLAHDA